VLTPGGIAIINLPLVTSLKNRMRLLVGKLPTTSVSYGEWWNNREWDGAHLHYFSMDSIRRICQISGLDIVSVHSVGSNARVKNRFISLLASEVTIVVKKP
jgi:hypothetical protein